MVFQEIKKKEELELPDAPEPDEGMPDERMEEEKSESKCMCTFRCCLTK